MSVDKQKMLRALEGAFVHSVTGQHSSIVLAVLRATVVFKVAIVQHCFYLQVKVTAFLVYLHNLGKSLNTGRF